MPSSCDLAAQSAAARESARRAVCKAVRQLADTERALAAPAGRHRAIDLRDVYSPAQR